MRKMIDSKDDALATLMRRERKVAPSPLPSVTPEAPSAKVDDDMKDAAPVSEGANVPPVMEDVAEIPAETAISDTPCGGKKIETADPGKTAPKAKHVRPRQEPRKPKGEEKVVPVKVAPELMAAAKLAAFDAGVSVSAMISGVFSSFCKDMAELAPEAIRQKLNDIYPISREKGVGTSLWLQPSLLRDVKILAVKANVPLKNFVNAAFALATNRNKKLTD
jgi:hypothetical protein